MTVCLLMVMVRDDCLFVDGNGERWLFVCWWWEMIVCLLMIMVRDDCLFVGGNGERWLFVCWC